MLQEDPKIALGQQPAADEACGLFILGDANKDTAPGVLIDLRGILEEALPEHPIGKSADLGLPPRAIFLDPHY